MKNLTYLAAILFLSVGLFSCNQQAKDSTELADEYNSRDDTANFNTAVGPENQGDFDAAAFAVEAADGGMTEEQLSRLAPGCMFDKAASKLVRAPNEVFLTSPYGDRKARHAPGGGLFTPAGLARAGPAVPGGHRRRHP